MKKTDGAQKICPQCGHRFRGNGFDGIDAHWRAKHENVMPYSKAWPLLKSGRFFAGEYMCSVPGHKEVEERLRWFPRRFPHSAADSHVSIRVKAAAGCFHRLHSPRAYALIDDYLYSSSFDGFIVEYESGPEVLAYLSFGAAAMPLVASVVQLVTAIIQARSRGIKEGDRPAEPLDLILRRVDGKEGFQGEPAQRIAIQDPVSRRRLEAAITKALRQLLRDPRS